MQTALNALYPPECLSWGAMTAANEGLCGSCWRDCHFLLDPVCDRCGVPVQSDGTESALYCETCLVTARGWRRGRAAFLYDGTGRRLVLGLKHADRHDIVGIAAKWMARAAPEVSEGALVVPVPLHWRRLLKRRHNQAALLGNALAREMMLSAVPDALKRIRATRSLDGTTREERFAILDGTIAVTGRRKDVISGRDILLVDDVMTSGATLSACTAALHGAGARNVDVVVLARVARDA